MNEQQAIDWIHKQLNFGIKPGLKRMEWMLERLGHPEHNTKMIHVAGTNGKGSTVTFLRNIFQEHDYKVGTFTSPYIETFNERVSINGLPIDGQSLVAYVEKIIPLSEELSQTPYGSPTEFEIITVIAFLYFADKQVDYAIFEVGLGGRLDSTNVLQPLLSVITTIGHDHIDILGDTLAEIAYEKAGIIKEGVPVITNVRQREALKEIEHKSKEQDSGMIKIDKDFFCEVNERPTGGETFKLKQDLFPLDNREWKIQMQGIHQCENAALALMSFLQIVDIEQLNINETDIEQGLLNSTWPGRFERIQIEPEVYVDGAHNIEALETLISTLKEKYHHKNIYFLVSILQGKKIEEMVAMLNEFSKNIYLTVFDFPKSYGYYELNKKFQNCEINISQDWRRSYKEITDQMQGDDILVITGSLYFVSEVRQWFRGKEI
ncbi:bifunctional folylpolyglutamate synthase/dihydrofolate synthase [Halalkalibacillus sediminis]|nr:folylpolyglutamate synthase/dihydrofolate synthase family protein [Halalkalibacillus sediminis]